MRARNLKPGFFKNEAIAAMPFEARLLFIGLWCLADREGRLENRPERIKAEVFPYDRVNIPKLLSVITSRGMTLHYTANSNQYIQIINFKKHQTPHPHEAKSELPPPNGHVTLMLGCSDVRNPDILNPSLLATPDMSRQTAPKPFSASRFQKPTAQEITAYARSIGFRLDGERFIAHYESNGWKVGRNPMKSWQAAVVTWKKGADPSQLIRPAIVSPPSVPEKELTEEDRQEALQELAKVKASLKKHSLTHQIPAATEADLERERKLV